METKWLEDFLSLARTMNFSRSADERFVTQPAFSRRIKALEVWAGAPTKWLEDFLSLAIWTQPSAKPIASVVRSYSPSLHRSRGQPL